MRHVGPISSGPQFTFQGQPPSAFGVDTLAIDGAVVGVSGSTANLGVPDGGVGWAKEAAEVIGNEAKTGAGAASLAVGTTYCTTDGAGNVLTLSNGTFNGQTHTFFGQAGYTGGKTTVVTPATTLGTVSATITLAGQSVTWKWGAGAWGVLANVGTTLA